MKIHIPASGYLNPLVFTTQLNGTNFLSIPNNGLHILVNMKLHCGISDEYVSMINGEASKSARNLRPDTIRTILIESLPHRPRLSRFVILLKGNYHLFNIRQLFEFIK